MLRGRGLRGVLLMSKGDFGRAIAELSYAIEHQAASVQAYYHRGLARMWRTDYKEALDDFNQAARRYCQVNPRANLDGTRSMLRRMR